MFYIILSLLLIYSLFIDNPINNLILFLITILLYSSYLFINQSYFITWIYIIIYASALLILFTYTLMIKCYVKITRFLLINLSLFKIIYHEIFYKYCIICSLLLLWFITKSSYSSYVITFFYYNPIYCSIFLLFNEPLFLIFLFIELIIAFIILIK